MNRFFSVFKYLHIHPLLWVVIAIGVMTAHFYELCLLFMIIFIHELGHAFAAAFFSWRIKKISLLPFGGVAEMDEHGNRPLREEAIVIISGPIQHIWLVLLGFLLWQWGIFTESLYQTFIQYNFMILFFNLLPIWPLDGGKLMFLLFSLKNPFPKSHKYTLYFSIIGTLIFLLMVLIMMPQNVNAWIIISFLVFSIYYEWKQRRFLFMRFLLERYYGKSNELRKLLPLEVQEDDSVLDVLERFHRGCKHPIIVRSTRKDNAILDENELLHVYFKEKNVTAKIKEILCVL
ncbi:stage IV sporulation protein FB [Niallia circulans]|uniref:M50 family metallopeptidase n=1 Tax=Niallia circulans TaxID=1397 RepID=UPI000BA5C243|nr:M50 family metallopeptidase [Niallia circulans]PAE11162.1 stage IV sporulation protein FB [Niallia circulans]